MGYTISMSVITTPAFDEAYKKLNPAQKKAVDTIDGPVMIIAGPGTGKTQMLTLRIANILRLTDTSPKSILALTFTDSAVQSMRKRLVDIIGQTGYLVYISTFHGFCNDVIGRNPDAFPHIVGAKNASEIDQIQIMEDVLAKAKITLLRPYGDPLFYIRPALGAIRELKREKISPEEYTKLISKQERDFKKIPDLVHEKGAHKGKMKGVYIDLQKKISKNKELAIVYALYQEELRKRKLYDYEDMILETINAFEKDENVLLQTQEQFQYILADEHQDANKSQNRILELLANFHDQPNIFVVGDEKQAIFRFQGASLENFLYFKKLYPQALIVTLEDNYRSTQTILDASHSLIEKNLVPFPELRTKLVSTSSNKNPKINISVLDFSKSDFELLFLVNDIKEKIQAGVAEESIAVIYRENKDVSAVSRAFERAHIPFTIDSNQDILSDEHIATFILLLTCIDDLGNDELLAKTLYINFLGIHSLDIFKLLAQAKKDRTSLFDVVSDSNTLKKIDLEKPDIIKHFYDKLLQWNSQSKNKNLTDCLETFANESGFITHILNLPNSADILAKLSTLFSEAQKLSHTKNGATIADFLLYLQIIQEYKLSIKSNSQPILSGGVHLMTAHRSKGQEFDYVYIVGAYDGHWGNKREIRHFHLPTQDFNSYERNSLEDERRLFYVALTRAKKQVTISFARTDGEGKEQLPTLFLDEIDPALLHKPDTKKFETTVQKDPTLLYSARLQSGLSIKDKKFIQSLFLHQGLNVTALNSYLTCPWNYFFRSLLRMPQSQTKHQLYGTAVHATLKTYFEAYKTEKGMGLKEILRVFEKNIAGKPFQKGDYEASLQKGNTALTGYIKTYSKTWSKNIETEVSISGVEIPLSLGPKKYLIPLRGVLDKVEKNEDGTVTVIDYKTAKPESRNEILGATKNSNGDKYRQLVFYKLLLDKQEAPKLNMKSGVIDFVEPDQKGHYHREEFQITDDEVKTLEETIKRVSTEILTLSFWNQTCKDKDCELCALRRMIT